MFVVICYYARADEPTYFPPSIVSCASARSARYQSVRRSPDGEPLTTGPPPGSVSHAADRVDQLRLTLSGRFLVRKQAHEGIERVPPRSRGQIPETLASIRDRRGTTFSGPVHQALQQFVPRCGSEEFGASRALPRGGRIEGEIATCSLVCWGTGPSFHRRGSRASSSSKAKGFGR